MHINRSDDTILICTCTYRNLHLMARRRTDHGFISGKNHLGRTSGFPGNNRRINLTDRSLFRTKATANPRFDHTDFGSRNIQCSSHDSSHMERNLRGRQHDQSAKMIHVTGCTERFHHSLLICLCVISTLYRVFTF